MADTVPSRIHPRPRVSDRIARGINACQRCRRRKQKCDLKYPNCSNCETARVACLTYHMGKEVELPRNYVTNLEKEIEALRRENSELRTRVRIQSPTSIDTEPINGSRLLPVDAPYTIANSQPPARDHLSSLVESVQDVVVEPSGRQPRFLGQGGGITLARLVMAAIRVDALPSPLRSTSHIYRPFSDMMAEAASLPPRHAAEHLVETYFQCRTPHLPIIERSHARIALDGAYRSTVDSQACANDSQREKDMFTTYMIFAIALCGLPGPVGNSRPIQSEGCFRSAVANIENVIVFAKSDVESLRSILLLAQFVALCPSQGSLWHLTGIALRMCIDIGLHWETDDQRLTMDPMILRDRRRLWHSTYQLDRSLSITLGRPLGIIDESTRVELPNPWAASRPAFGESTVPEEYEIHNQLAQNHLFRMSRLESEIVHVQHSQSWSAKIAYPRANYTSWVQDIEPRLREWYNTIPFTGKAHMSSIFASQAYWDVVYNNAVLLLHRPNSMVPHVSAESLLVSFEASRNTIASIKILQRDGKVDIIWRSAHQLFMAGLCVIYCLWHSKDIRDRHSVGACIQTLQSCASTLSAMSETFHGASSCRDAFDSLSLATINWLLTYDAEKVQQSRQEFEDHLKELFQQLQPSRRNILSSPNRCDESISTMLSTESFAFSELLNSAAQWPEFQGSMFEFMGAEHSELL